MHTSDFANVATRDVGERRRKHISGLLLAGVCIICAGGIIIIPAIVNGFPFIFQDSADYLVFKPHLYRSPFYGIWIWFFHLNRFLWAVVIAQALVLSHLLYVLIRVTIGRYTEIILVGSVLLLTTLSSLPYFADLIMPDILAPIMFLACYLIVFQHGRLSKIERLYFCLLACIATAAHLSHLYLAAAMGSVFIAAAYLLCRSWTAIRQQALRMLIPVILTIIAFMTYNGVVFRQFTLSPAGQTFLLANLLEHGPARDYLAAACPTAGFRICEEAGTLPRTAEEFLWDGDLDRLGGFAAMAPEARRIVLATVATRPAEVLHMIAGNFIGSLATHEPAKEFAPDYLKPTAPIFEVLRLKFGADALAAFRNSAQMRGSIPHSAIAKIDGVVVPLSAVWLVGSTVFLLTRRKHHDLVAFVAFVLIFVALNALLCGTVSGVQDRYQARVTWLLPLAALLVTSALAVENRMSQRSLAKLYVAADSRTNG